MSLLRIFRRPDYQSEVTHFIQDLKAARPDLESQQQVGRSIWWDRAVDRDLQREWQAARVAQKPYVYGSGQ